MITEEQRQMVIDSLVLYLMEELAEMLFYRSLVTLPNVPEITP